MLKGVFSSWEALETNWLRDISSFSSRSDMELKALASWANSFLPRTSTRAERSPRLMRDMPALNSPMGRVMVRTTNMLMMSAEAATSSIHKSIWLRRELKFS